MKRTLKIAIVLVVMALVLCSFLAIFASAEDADDTLGITSISSGNLESGDPTKDYLTDGVYPEQYPNIGGQQFALNNCGTLTVKSGVNVDGTSNKYAFYTPDAYTGTLSSTYSVYAVKNNLATETSAAAMIAKLSASSNTIKNNLDGNAFLYDIDIATTENYKNFPYKARFQLFLTYLDATGTYASKTIEVMLSQKSLGSTDATISRGSDSYDIDTSKWNHISLAVYTVRNDASYDVYVAVWVNEEFAFASKAFSGYEYYTVDGTKHIGAAINHVRFLLNGTASVDDRAGIALDNTNYRMVDRSVNTKFDSILNAGSDLTDWGGSVYNADKMPETLPVIGDAQMTGIRYYTSSAVKYTGSFSTALTNAVAGSTVSFYNDVTYASETANNDEYINLNKKLVIDLNSHTLNVNQTNQLRLHTNDEITVKNGTIQTAKTNNSPYPFFVLNKADYSALTLDNVNTFNTFIYTTLNGTSVTINGGTHVITQAPGGTVGRAFINAVGAIDVTVNDATFFNDASAGIISSLSRKQAADVADSNFTFNSCTFIEDPSDKGTVSGTHGSSRVYGQGIIWYANENSFFNFNNCDINAAVNPQRYWDDASFCDYIGSDAANYWGPIQSGAIVFGEGTRYNSAYTMATGGIIVTANNFVLGSIEGSEALTITECADSTYVNSAFDFALTERELTLVFDVGVVNGANYAFEYSDGTNTLYTNDIKTALEGAAEGTTVTLLKNWEHTGETDNDSTPNDSFRIATVSRNITLDLNDFTLTIIQLEQNAIFVTKTLTVTNGTLRAAYNTTAWFNNYTHPIFQPNGSSSVITLNDVDTYLGALAYSYNKSNWTVNVTGGTHYITNAAQGAYGPGWFCSRTSATLNATGATFYISGNGALAGATTHNIEEASAGENTFNFDGCTIVSTLDTSFIPNANENTKINFTNNCIIDASLIPAVYKTDTNMTTGENWGPMTEGSITFSSGTRYNSDKTMIGGGVIAFADGCEAVEFAVLDSMTFYPTTSTPFTDSFATTETGHTLLTDITVASPSILDAYNFQYELRDKKAYATDFVEAIKAADAGSTLVFLKDYTIESKTAENDEIIHSFYNPFTFDLGGNTLTVQQSNQLRIHIGAALTIKNGTIQTAKTNNLPYPFLQFNKGGYSALTLDNVNTFNTFIFTTVTDTSVTINGGTHVVTQAPGGTQGRAFINAVGAIDVTVNDATFFNDASAGIISSLSRKQAANVADSNFVFNSCTFIEDPSDKGVVSGTHGSARVMGQGIIWYANENSFFNFNNCDINAAVNPQRYWDSASFTDCIGSDAANYWGPIQPGAIVFNTGTRYNSAYTMATGGIIVAPNGYALGATEGSETVTITDCADSSYTNEAFDFTFTERELTLTYNVAVMYPQGYKVKYTVGGVENYGDNLVEALAAADAGTVIYLQGNYTIHEKWNETDDLHIIATVSKSLTLDLGDNVLSVYQEWQQCFNVTSDFTVRNGEIRVVRSSDYDYAAKPENYTFNNKSYPLFRLSGYSKTFTLENVNTYSGALIFNYNRTATVNIIGGKHHITHHDISGAQGCWGGFIESRGRTTFTAEGATFFVDRSGWIATITSYYDGYISDEEPHAPVGSTFTFNGCTLISDPGDTDGNYTLFPYANEFTKLIFNNCSIYGSINPEVYSNDKDRFNSVLWDKMPAENLILGEGTRVATSINGKALSFAGYTFDPETANLGFIEEVTTEAISLKTCNDRPYTEGYIFTTKTFKLTFNLVVADTVNITITYHYPDGSTELVSANLNDVITAFKEYDVPENINNGWVQIIFDGGWSTSMYGEKLTELTVSGRVHLYPSASSKRAYLSSAMYNLTLYGNVGVNLLLPDGENIPEGIALGDIYDANGNLVLTYKDNVIGGDIEYRLYEVGKSSVLELDNPLSCKVYFTYNNVEFIQTITLNPYDYVVKVMTDSDSNPKSVTLLADMVRYAETLYRFANKNDTATPAYITKEFAHQGSTTTLSALAASNCSDLATESSFTGGAAGSFTASDYISAISFDLGGADPSYIIYFKENTRVVDVKFIMNDAYINDKNGYNRGKAVYGMDKSLSTYFDGTEYLSMAHSTGISIYNLDGFVEFEITILDENGGKHSVSCKGDYNLNDYYRGIAPSGDITAADIARAKNILLALRSFATSTALYRYDIDNAGETVSNKVSVYYEDFGAVADGATDDFGAIYAAHEYANTLKAQGRDVTVYAIKPDGNIAEGSTFFIDNTDSSLETFKKSAAIKTDTVWTGANFVINDFAFFEGGDSANPSYTKVERASNDAFYTPIFNVLPDVVTVPSYDAYTKLNLPETRQLLTTDTEFPEIAALDLPFETAFVVIRNAKHRNFVRSGANAGASVQQEVILVDTKTGKIDKSTPITLDYPTITGVYIYDANEDAITIDGGSFNTLYNRVNTYSYCNRGIYITRSNVTIKNAVNTYTYSAFNDKVSGGAPMQQFIGTRYTHNTVIENCYIESPRRFWDVDNGDGTGTVNRGSYAITANVTSSLTIRGVKQNNFYVDYIIGAGAVAGSDGLIDHRGVIGTNYCKNVLFEDNKMSAYDAHTGLHNLVVKGSEVERINVIGSGNVHIENTTVHTANTQAAVVLRSDYNSHFEGDVTLKNVTLETYTNKYVGLFWMTFANYNTGLYYTDNYQWDSDGDGTLDTTDQYYTQDKTKGDGDDSRYYSSYLPQNVYVDGLTVLYGGSITNDDSQELGGIYTPGTAEAFTSNNGKVALYNAYSTSSSDAYNFLVHEWKCDISKQGDYFEEGILFWKETYTVSHPVKPTEYVYNNSGYTINEYVYNGSVNNSLEFLDSLVIENAS